MNIKKGDVIKITNLPRAYNDIYKGLFGIVDCIYSECNLSFNYMFQIILTYPNKHFLNCYKDEVVLATKKESFMFMLYGSNALRGCKLNESLD